MKISVALCTFNGARFLQAELATIAAQTRPPHEVVVGDDGSTDATLEIVAAFGAGTPFPVRVLPPATERLGVSRNFERTIAATTGDVIALADQDDTWDQVKLERLAAAFDSPAQPGLVFSDGHLIDGDGRSLAGGCWERVGLTAREVAQIDGIGLGDPFATILDRQLTVRGTVMGTTMAFRSDLRSLALPFPGWLPRHGKAPLLHDGWIALLAAAAGPVRAIPERLIAYRLHDQQEIGLHGKPARPTLGTMGTGEGAAEARRADIRWMEALDERIAPLPADRRATVHEALATRIAHYQVRANLPANRFRRLPPVAQEVATGRYRRHASGLLSALRDVVQK